MPLKTISNFKIKLLGNMRLFNLQNLEIIKKIFSFKERIEC
jgi:hypothetical protein